MTPKKLLLMLALILAIPLVGLAASYFILGGAYSVSLSVSSLSSAVEKSLSSNSAESYQPIEGKDYKIASTKFFEDKQWAVVLVNPLNNFSDSASIVFQQKNNAYELVLGPANSFVSSDYRLVPQSVADYLKGAK